MIVFLLSLGGIPPTAGFIGRLLLFKSAVQASQIPLAGRARRHQRHLALLLLRLVLRMFLTEAKAKEAVTAGWPLGTALAASAVFTLWVGVYAQPVLDWTSKILVAGFR